MPWAHNHALRDLEKRKPETRTALKGWKQIAVFLGQPVAVAQHWGATGMPITREGRHVVASPEQLSRWPGQESETSEAHIVPGDIDLAADLKRGLADVRQHQRHKE